MLMCSAGERSLAGFSGPGHLPARPGDDERGNDALGSAITLATSVILFDEAHRRRQRPSQRLDGPGCQNVAANVTSSISTSGSTKILSGSDYNCKDKSPGSNIV